jgi:hypothetical protein
LPDCAEEEVDNVPEGLFFGGFCLVFVPVEDGVPVDGVGVFSGSVWAKTADDSMTEAISTAKKIILFIDLIYSSV